MGAPLGNLNRAKGSMICDYLRSEVMRDNGHRIRQGMALVVNRFSKDGNLQDGVFIRDTLDGKPKQQVDITNDNNGLQSLQVMFVQAIAGAVAEQQAIADEQAQALGLTVEMEKISNESSP